MRRLNDLFTAIDEVVERATSEPSEAGVFKGNRSIGRSMDARALGWQTLSLLLFCCSSGPFPSPLSRATLPRTPRNSRDDLLDVHPVGRRARLVRARRGSCGAALSGALPRRGRFFPSNSEKSGRNKSSGDGVDSSLSVGLQAPFLGRASETPVPRAFLNLTVPMSRWPSA